MLVDGHAHLHVPDFDADRDEVRRRARAAGVAAVLVVAHGASTERVAEVTTPSARRLFPKLDEVLAPAERA